MIGHAAGVLLSREELQRASAICAAAGAWLIVDNTYEHFTYGGAQHECVHGPHVINVFSFSKVRNVDRRRTTHFKIFTLMCPQYVNSSLAQKPVGEDTLTAFGAEACRGSCCICQVRRVVYNAAWQAYGMMGWRCGYIAFPTPEAGAPADLGAQLTKVQDTIPICASQVTPFWTGTPVPNEGTAPAKHRVLMSRIAQPH